MASLYDERELTNSIKLLTTLVLASAVINAGLLGVAIALLLNSDISLVVCK